jgi:ribosomal protein L16 Arg81 hydroxylase
MKLLQTTRSTELFQKLISPITLTDFFENYWEKKVLYIPRNDPHYYRDILTFDDVDAYLSRTDLRYPYIRLVQAGRELPLNTYAYDSVFGENVFQGNLDLDKLFQLYHGGATMCMQLQNLALPKLREFTNHIERFFEFRTQSTLFLTPPKSQGFTSHFDSHDFFIFQIYGEKQWKIYPNPVEFPLAGHRVLDSEVNLTVPPDFEPNVRPGDCLYVPRGVYHEALTNETTSLQISLGVFPFIWCDVMHKIIDDLAAEHASLRKASVTPTVHQNGRTMFEFEEILRLLREKGKPEQAIADLKRKSFSKQSKSCENRLLDLEKLASFGPNSLLQKRDIHLAIERGTETVTLFFYDKELTLPDCVLPEIEFISTNKPFRAADLPGALDEESKSVLICKLVEEGLIRFVPG